MGTQGPARRPTPLAIWIVVGLLLLATLAGVAYVSVTHVPPTPPALSFSLGSPQPFTVGNTTYTKVSLVNANLTNVDQVGISLQEQGAPLPPAYLAHAPWVDDILCGGGGLQPGMLSWAPNVSSCHAEPGYWYTLLVNSTGAVLAINALATSSSSPTIPGPAWYPANSSAAVVSAGSALVLVSQRSLIGTGYEVVVGDAGRVARLTLSPSSTASPTFLMDYLVNSLLCPQTALGGSLQSVVNNVTFNTTSAVPLSDLELNLTSVNHSLWSVSLSRYTACPTLPAPSTGNYGWFAILWAGPYRPIAYYSLTGQGPQWSDLTPGATSSLSPSLNLTLEFLSWGGLTSPSEATHLDILDRGVPSAESWGGTLTDGVGILFD